MDIETVIDTVMVIIQTIVGITPTLNNGNDNIRLLNQPQNGYDAYNGRGIWMVIFISQIIVV